MKKNIITIFILASTLMAINAESREDGTHLLQECTHALEKLKPNMLTLIDLKTVSCTKLISEIYTNLSLIGKEVANVCIKLDEPIHIRSNEDGIKFKVRQAKRVKVVVDYLNNHPEKLHQPKEDLVFFAIVNAFQCNKEEGLDK